jgi:hypothetical protein
MRHDFAVKVDECCSSDIYKYKKILQTNAALLFARGRERMTTQLPELVEYSFSSEGQSNDAIEAARETLMYVAGNPEVL